MVKITYDLENSNIKVMAKVKPIGHIWDLEFKSICLLSFRGNRSTFGWDIANSIFDLGHSRSRSWPSSNTMVTFEVLRSIDMFTFRCVAIAPFLAEIKQIPYLISTILGQGHDENRPKSNQVIDRSGQTIVPKKKEIQSCVQMLSREQEAAAGGGGAGAGGGARTGTKT